MQTNGSGLNSGYGCDRFVKFGKSKDTLYSLAKLDIHYDKVVCWAFLTQDLLLDLSQYSNNVYNITTIGEELINGNLYIKKTVTFPYISAYLFGSNDFCVEFYSYFTGSGEEWRYIQTKYNTPWTNTPNFGARNWANFGIVRDGISWDNQISGILNNQWCHYALTRQSGTLRLFRDGVLVSSSTNTVNYNGIGDGIRWNFTRCKGNQALRITIGHCRYSSNFSTNTINLLPIKFNSYKEALESKVSKKNNFLIRKESNGLQYNQSIPTEYINKRPIYAYGQSFDLLALSPVIWLDASDSSTITLVSGAVSEWRDKSGNNRHASQGTSANRPVMSTLNGKSVLSFDGSNDFLQYNLSIGTQTNFTYVIVFKHTNDTYGLPSFGRSPSNFGLHNSSGTNGYRFYTNQGYNQVTLNSGNGNQYFESNKWQIAVGDTNGIPVTSYGNYLIYIGGDPFDSSRRLNGQIAEVCLFPSVLSQSDRELVEGYLAWKWGLVNNLPSTHPYKLRPPLSGNVITNIRNWNITYQRPKARSSYKYKTYKEGLIGYRYNGYFADDVNWFNTATLHGDSNILTSIDKFTSSSTYYSWMWIGYFKASATGLWTFFTNSDDASYLWIGDNALNNNFTTANCIVNNGNTHAPQERSGTINLVANKYYPIRIIFGQASGGDIMTVSFTPPNGSKTTNGLGYYYNQEVFDL